MLNVFKNETLKTLGTAAAGWLLSEISHYLNDRRERKKAIGRALSDLLEIRHRFIAVDSLMKELGRLGVPIAVLNQVQLRPLLQQVLPDWPALVSRYNESVSLVSSVAPVLGFRLRSQELVERIFQIGDAVAASNQFAAVMWHQQASPLLMKHATETLDKACLELAFRHNVTTWWKVRHILRKRTERTAEWQQFFDILKQAIAAEQAAAKSQPPPPPQTPPAPPTQTA